MPPDTLTDTKADIAAHRFNSGMLCSQAVLSVFCEASGLELAVAMRLASGLGGGIGLTGNICGAATGATLALGLAYGPPGASGAEAKHKVFAPVQTFLTRFESLQGTLVCRDILDGLDLTDPAVATSPRAEQAFATTCTACVRGAVEIVEEIMSRSAS